jgi:hypothetical protein
MDDEDYSAKQRCRSGRYNSAMSYSLLFVAGPSAVGKTTYCATLEWALHFTHVDIDADNVLRTYGIRAEWSQYERDNPRPLAEALLKRAAVEGRAGAIVSVPSSRVIKPEWLRPMFAAGFCVLVLWAPREFCVNSARQRATKRHETFDVGAYGRATWKCFRTYSGPEFTRVRLEVCSPDGVRLDDSIIISSVQQRLAAP